jgi:Na+/H+-dicarboxylate symporter
MTVLLGVLIHGFIVLPIIYGVATRQWPFRFVLNMFEAVTTAFGTASRYNFQNYYFRLDF